MLGNLKGWRTVIMLGLTSVIPIANLFGYAVDPEAITSAREIVEQILILAGLFAAFIGRWNASTPIFRKNK